MVDLLGGLLTCKAVTLAKNTICHKYKENFLMKKIVMFSHIVVKNPSSVSKVHFIWINASSEVIVIIILHSIYQRSQSKSPTFSISSKVRGIMTIYPVSILRSLCKLNPQELRRWWLPTLGQHFSSPVPTWYLALL